jgi:large subunit ribosomal protein L21
MKFAVIRTGGKQYIVSPKDKVKIEKLNAEEGQTVEFDDVLLVSDKDKIDLGTPKLKTKVTAKVLKQGKRDKVTVAKYKPKVRYHKVYGHKQPYTEVEIQKIS